MLINGPTGTGKEVLSRFIHDRSARAGKPFIAINCAAMPETMLEAMLFGHQKGAFTGANSASEGFFRAADGGTLLLDEIAEMPLSLQAKLLRALQEREVVPIGATQPIKVDVRVIACANRDLPTEVDEGRFRADLYYRLNVFPLMLRPLCERPDDIAPLAFTMMLRHVPQGADMPWIGEAALDMLASHPWPGNVRELENLIRRICALYAEETITARIVERELAEQAAPLSADGPITLATLIERHLASYFASQTDGVPPPGLYDRILADVERPLFQLTLAATRGNQVRAAEVLGLNRNTLRKRINDLGIEAARGRR